MYSTAKSSGNGKRNSGSRDTTSSSRPFCPTTSSSRPFCSTCKKVGKSESEYTSHYPKSNPGPNGVVTCPYILNTVCKKCGVTGHWASASFCPELLKKNNKPLQPINKNSVVPVTKNRFQSLDIDSEDDEPETVEPETKKTFSYADILKNIQKPIVVLDTLLISDIHRSPEEDKMYRLNIWKNFKEGKYKSWADSSDEEDE